MKKTIWVIETRLPGSPNWDGGEQVFFTSKGDALRCVRGDQKSWLADGAKYRIWRFDRKPGGPALSAKQLAKTKGR